MQRSYETFPKLMNQFLEGTSTLCKSFYREDCLAAEMFVNTEVSAIKGPQRRSSGKCLKVKLALQSEARALWRKIILTNGRETTLICLSSGQIACRSASQRRELRKILVWIGVSRQQQLTSNLRFRVLCVSPSTRVWLMMMDGSEILLTQVEFDADH